jgi:hypothetical protein
MKIRGLVVAVVVLGALVGALYWSSHHKPSSTAAASADVAPKILSLNQADINQVDIKKKGTDPVTLKKNASGQWQLTQPKPLGADQDATSAVLATLSQLSSDRLVDSKASNLSQYGLAEPSLEVDVTEKGNKTQQLLIGDNTPTGSDVYAALRGDPRVFTLPSYERSSIDKTEPDLRDKRLVTLEPDKISRVEISTRKSDIEFGRNKDEWQILKPKPLRADSTKVGDLVRDLTGARMDLSGSEEDRKKLAAAFASASPVGTAKLTDESGTQELQIRKSKDDYYAKSSVVAGVYKVASTVGQSLDKSLDDFRNKNLFDFGYTQPDKIEMHAGAKAYFLTHSGEDWWSADGKKMDSETVETLLDRIRDLSAARFVDSGFGSPAIDLTVTSNSGKRTENVMISKSGDKYVAKRGSDPTLYQLDASPVDDLQKAAEGLKPAAPPKK